MSDSPDDAINELIVEGAFELNEDGSHVRVSGLGIDKARVLLEDPEMVRLLLSAQFMSDPAMLMNSLIGFVMSSDDTRKAFVDFFFKGEQ